MVEQRTENPRVGGSIPPLGTTFKIPQSSDIIRNDRFRIFIPVRVKVPKKHN